MNQKDNARTLWCLIAGIIIYLAVASIPVLIFSKDKLFMWLSLFVGCAMAVLMTVAMQVSIDKSIHMEAKQEAFLAWMSVARLVVMAGVLLAVGFTRVLNVLLVFAGVFSLKISAYLQPILINFFNKKSK